MTKKKAVKTPPTPDIVYKSMTIVSQSGMPVMGGHTCEDAITVKTVENVISVRNDPSSIPCPQIKVYGLKEDYAVPRQLIINITCKK